MIAPRDLEDLQDGAAARILGDEFLGGLVVIKEQYSSTVAEDGVTLVSEADDIETKVLQAIGTLNEKSGKIGAVALVMMPSVEKANPNVGGLSAELVLKVRYVVAPLFNNGDTGHHKSEGQLATRGAILFQFWSPFPGGNPFVMDANPLDPINNELLPGNNGYEVTHRAKWSVGSGAKVMRPLITIATGEATLTCSTAGAEVRYTLDGTAPSKGNAAALVYDAPFAVVPGDVVRAAAWKADFFESDTAILTAT